MFTEKGLARAAHDKVNLALPNPCNPSATFRFLENGVLSKFEFPASPAATQRRHTLKKAVHDASFFWEGEPGRQYR